MFYGNGETMHDNRVLLNELIEEIIENKNDLKNDKEYLSYSKYLEMYAFENDLINRKVKHIAGIDEAGRGPLAGPVVAACVILPEHFYLPGLNDSKKLSAKKRDEYYEIIIQEAISFGIGTVGVEEIDQHNIYNSTKMAMKKSILNLSIRPKHLLIDAMKLDIDIDQTNIIKGDQKSITIAAASVIAKVTRDRYMEKLDKAYPLYEFRNNKGYGTKAHLNAIKQYGVTPVHRKSFEPVKTIIKKERTIFNYKG